MPHALHHSGQIAPTLLLTLLCVMDAIGLSCAEDAGNYPPKPGQLTAISVALSVYGLPAETVVPSIAWVEGADLNCTDANGIHGWVSGAGCVSGEFVHGDWLRAPHITVAAQDDAIWNTSLAHELAHFAAWQQGDDDQNHMGRMFCDVDQPRPCFPDRGLVLQTRVDMAAYVQ